MRIHKGDQVIVRSGKDKGKKAEVVRAMPAVGQGDPRGRQRGQASRQADAGHPAGWRHRQVHAGSRLHGCPALQELRTARPGPACRSDTEGNKVRVCRKCGAEL